MALADTEADLLVWSFLWLMGVKEALVWEIGSSKIWVRDWVKPSVRLLLRLYLTLTVRVRPGITIL